MLREEILGHQNLLLALSCVRRSDTPLAWHGLCLPHSLSGSQVSLGLPTSPRALAHRPEHLALGILTLVL